MKLLPCLTFALVTVSCLHAASPSQANWLSANSANLPGALCTVEIVDSSPASTRLVLECPGFWVLPSLQNGASQTQVQMPGAKGSTSLVGLPELPIIGKLIALPEDREAEIIIQKVQTMAFPCANPYLVEPAEGEPNSPSNPLPATGLMPSAWASAATPGIMKDHRLVPISIYPLRYDFEHQQYLLATRLEIEIKTSEPSTENVKSFFAPASQAFAPIYQETIDNLSEFNTATPLVSEGSRGKYVIVLADAYVSNAFLGLFTTWKKQLGYQVILKPLSETGSTKEAIKAAIMDEYYRGDAPLDYVLLIGDVPPNPTGIPTWDINKPGSAEQDPTDLPYTLLEGQDYFPDVFIGRISVSSSTDLLVALNKILNYEKNPYLTDPTWFKKALISGGNYSDTPPAPITPVWTSLWLREKMLDYGYTQVDTAFYWGPPESPNADTPYITTSITNGVGIVAYRGWGDESGWQYPAYQTPDLYSLTNGFKLPVVVSIVCETGNFRDVVDPCFGEAWIRLGTGPTPAGASAFFGPSDLHTNTKWNNAMYAGFFEGLLEENLYRIGQSALRSKLEAYYGFPEEAGEGGLVEFYFHTYNILGDPELPIWTDTPAQISLDIPDQVQPGSQVIAATATAVDGSPLGGAYVAFYKENEILAGSVANGNGEVAVSVEPLTAGKIYVTVSKQNYKAKQDSIIVQVGDFPIGISGIGAGSGAAQAGSSFNLELTLQNYGATDLTAIQAVLTTSDAYTTISDTTATVSNLPALGEAAASFPCSLAAAAGDNHVVEFTLKLSNASHNSEAKFTLPVGGIQLIPVGYDAASGSLEPGNTAQLRLFLGNVGILAAQGLTGTLSCNSSAVDITSPQVIFPTIQPNATAPSSTLNTLQVDAAAATGQQIILELALSAAGGFTQTISIPVQLGLPASSDPLGPDSYGYYAYDDTDTDYPEAPVYAWVELDPAYGGSGGTLYALDDDASLSLEMPFAFKYYDSEYDSLTICSNGYVSFGETWMAEFRNWNLPSALGPAALVSPFWDDLKADTSGGNPGADIQVFYQYDEPGGRLIIEWSRAINRYGYENLSTWKKETFEVILSDPSVNATATGDGEILFQYQEVYDVDDNNNYATVGIEDEGHVRGLQYVYSNSYPSAAAPLAANRAIKITTNPPSSVASLNPGGPRLTASLSAPRPNPANPTTTLNYYLPESGQTELILYNTAGQRVAVLLDKPMPAGEHFLQVDGTSMASGLYFVIMNYQGMSLSQKVLILK